MKANTKALTVPALYRMCYAASILSCVLLSACRQEQIDAFGMAAEILVAVVEDSCDYAFDGECDEPTYCAYGTDTTDCSDSSSFGYGSGDNSCLFALDGACDEPTYCDYGTDTTDCSGSSSSGYGSEADQASGTPDQLTDSNTTEPIQFERHIPDAVANDCIQTSHPSGVTALTFFKARMKNICTYTVTVNYGFSVQLDGTPIHVPWCTVGHGGSKGGSMTLSPGEDEPVAPIDFGKPYTILWCACDYRLAWAAFAEPDGPDYNDCVCRCAPQ